ETRCDHALRVQHERAGKRNAVALLIRFRHGRVENPVPLDGGRARIRQQRERDAAPLRKVGQDGHRIVANGSQRETLTLQFRHTALQLHELRLAIGSPVRRSEEYEHEPLGPRQRRQRPRLSLLIEQCEIEYPLLREVYWFRSRSARRAAKSLRLARRMAVAMNGAN